MHGGQELRILQPPVTCATTLDEVYPVPLNPDLPLHSLYPKPLMRCTLCPVGLNPDLPLHLNPAIAPPPPPPKP